MATGRAGRVRAELRLHPARRQPSGSTGGKRAYLDKVIWRYIPDPWDAANDLAAGEVDWWEQPPLEFIPKIEQNPDLQTFLIDPLGTQGWLRPNWLHPPFNNKKARQALLHMTDQVTYLLGPLAVAILSALLFGLCLRRPLRDKRSVPSR